MSIPGKRRHFIIDKGIEEDAKLNIYPFRSNLKESIEKIDKHTDEKVVGIVYDETYTIELLTAKKDKDERE